jgi:hypothetical protein
LWLNGVRNRDSQTISLSNCVVSTDHDVGFRGSFSVAVSRMPVANGAGGLTETLQTRARTWQHCASLVKAASDCLIMASEGAA